MNELRFTTEHEWLRLEDNGLVSVGITTYAQDALGDLVFVQLPSLQHYGAGEEVAVLESVKAASSIEMPIPGEIVEVNQTLESNPEVVNTDPLGEGWFFRMRPHDCATLDALLDQDAYERLLNANANA